MSEKKFSNKEAIKFAWEKVKENLGFFLLVGVVFYIVSFLPSIARKLMKETESLNLDIIFTILYILFQALSILVGLGLNKIMLKVIDKQKPKFTDLFSQYRLFWKYLFATILYSLIIMIPVGISMLLSLFLVKDNQNPIYIFIPIIIFIIAIVFSILVGIRVQFFPYLIIEGLGPIEALKESFRITKGLVGDLFVFGLVMMAIALAGLLALFVGTLITMPIVAIATAFVYRKLKQKTKIIS
jgi:hypothetical protein